MKVLLQPTIGSWRIIFWTTVGLYVVEIIVYMLCGSGEEQQWNKIEQEPGESQPLKTQNDERKQPDSV